MSYSPYDTITQTQDVRIQGAMHQVYAWMMAGLLVTGAVAMFVANTPALAGLFLGNSLVFFGLLIAEVALVWILSANIRKMSPALATGMFLGYSLLNGLTFAIIFLIYTAASIAGTFFATAGMFGATSLYGYVTKRDLSHWGSFLFMGLIGFLLASIINMFLASSTLYWILTYGGIVLFLGLTIWDTQQIKQMMRQARSEDDIHRVTILGALKLYLDFINLFLLLLRILGNRR